MGEVKTLRPKKAYIDKVQEFFDSLNEQEKEAVNLGEWWKLWEVVGQQFFSSYATLGILWSTIYNIDNEVYNTLGFVPVGAFAYTDIKEISLDVESLYWGAFSNSELEEITLTKRLKKIEQSALVVSNSNSNNLVINYEGTKKEFKTVSKDNFWCKPKYAEETHSVCVRCSDGELEYGDK